VNQLPDKPRCPRCGSNAIGLLKAEEEKVLPMIEKRGEKLTQSEEKLQKQASETAQLIAKCGKRLYSPDVAEILTKEPKLTNRFYELVLEAERKAMSKRFG
jgi:ATP-dependent Lhr-like helicase